jgi:hypothetical protein
MISKPKLLGAAAFSLALAGGGVAGAMLGTPDTSGAQDGTTTTTVAAKDDARPRPAVRRAARGLREARADSLDAAAKALDMPVADLKAELKAGKSIADVAKEKNVDLQKVIDAIVADRTAHLQDRISKLPDEVTAAVNRKGLGTHPDGPPPAPADSGDSSS